MSSFAKLYTSFKVYVFSIAGTSTKSTVASLSCSPGDRCSNINVDDLQLSSVSFSLLYTLRLFSLFLGSLRVPQNTVAKMSRWQEVLHLYSPLAKIRRKLALITQAVTRKKHTTYYPENCQVQVYLFIEKTRIHPATWVINARTV